MKHTILLFFGILLCSLSNAQSDSCKQKLSAFVKNIELFNHLYPQEKVYLHFDNTGYYLGETIWFKAYLTIAEQNKPTPLSRVLYVELLTPEGNIVETKKLKTIDGQCHGGFLLPKTTLRAGFYEVRAYTRMMLNQEGTVFSRIFPVFDIPQTEGAYQPPKMTLPPPSQQAVSVREKKEKLKDINITFYPEGGQLVNGLTSIVAFKATDENGKSIDVFGTVYNAQNEAVTTFSTTHQGMGNFCFCPDETPSSVKILFEGKEHSFSPIEEFQNPDYQNGALPNEKDYRRTLYWNPNVKTDSEGKASVAFYNNSTCKKMTISAETLTSEGIPGLYKE
jgi:uncharacterized protein YfaS (alpha-2-macroglobulin family)